MTPGTSEPVGPAIMLMPRQFEDRWDFGRHLVRTLAPLDSALIRLDPALWDWLSLHFFDLVCPKGADGRRKIGEPVRYALAADNHQKRTRHLVRTAWLLVREHGENARFMLSGAPDVHGELVEQLTNRQEIVGSRAVIGAASRLYATEGGFKAGATSRNRAGTVRRLVVLVRQLKMTFDLDSMTPEQVEALLPREFDRFRSAAGARDLPRRAGRRLLDRLLGGARA